MREREKKSKQIAWHMLWVFTAVTVFVAVFGQIYEYFSHEITSLYMELAFLIPFVGGVAPMLFIYLLGGKGLPSEIARYSYYTALVAGILAALFQGILEIYGTTNRVWSIIFIIVIIGFVMTFFVAEGMTIFANRDKRN